MSYRDSTFSNVTFDLIQSSFIFGVLRIINAKFFDKYKKDDWLKLYFNYNILMRAIILYYTPHYNQKVKRDLFKLASEPGKLPTLKEIMYSIKDSLYWCTNCIPPHYYICQNCKPLSSLLSWLYTNILTCIYDQWTIIHWLLVLLLIESLNIFFLQVFIVSTVNL